MSMELLEITCRKCGLPFHACKDSIADKSKLCGDCGYIRCSECRKKVMILTLESTFKCPYCNADITGAFGP